MADKQKTGLAALFQQAFSGYNPADISDQSLPLMSGGSRMIYGSDGLSADPSGTTATSVTGEMDWMAEKKMPSDRFAKYALIQDMVCDPVLSGALDMHISHALSVDSQTGNILEITAKTPEFAELAAQLQGDLGLMLNQGLPSWCKLMATFGVHYIRPYAEDKKGVVDIESSYYTMAQQIREYVRGGQCAGFTSEYLKEQVNGGEVRLVEPWQLVSLRVPYWQPNLYQEPFNPTGRQYSLYDELHRRTPIETQDYGTSFLEFAYPAWCDLNDAIRSMKGSRYNASRIDRFIALGMDNLDPARAAQYLNLVGTQLRKDLEAAHRKGRQKGLIPSIWNTMVPNLSGSKGGVTIDTQTISPDIQHIEDVMFHLKRMAAGLGIDASLLGWGDLMSGGLGDGGFFRTSVQAAVRANWLRVGVANSVNRLIDIHMAYKYGKVFPAGTARPIEIRFHSLNTAIESEQAEATEIRTGYATALATLLDTIENGRLADSESFKRLVLTDIIRIDKDKTEQIIKDLASAAKAAGGEGFMESVGYKGGSEGFDDYLATVIHKQLINLLGDQ